MAVSVRSNASTTSVLAKRCTADSQTFALSEAAPAHHTSLASLQNID